MKETSIISLFYDKKKIPKDDCYFLPPDVVVTTDTICEKTHFLHEWSSPKQIAHKLVEVNVSDIAAGGGVPTKCFLNLGLSKFSSQTKWITEFSKEFRKRLKIYQIELCGGDTVYSEITTLTLTMMGKTNSPKNRTDGKDGDFLYITGNLGLSAVGIRALQKKANVASPKLLKQALSKHLTPVSRLEFSKELYSKYSVHAIMDVTDGLYQDTQKLANASGLKLEIDLEPVPVLPEVKKLLSIDEILNSGEELELLFLSPEEIPVKVGNGFKPFLANATITKIGRAIGKSKIGKVEFKLNGKKYKVSKNGFEHFE